MKPHSTSSAIRKMGIKTIMGLYFTDTGGMWFKKWERTGVSKDEAVSGGSHVGGGNAGRCTAVETSCGHFNSETHNNHRTQSFPQEMKRGLPTNICT